MADHPILAIVARSHLHDQQEGAVAQLDELPAGASRETDPSKKSSLRMHRRDSVRGGSPRVVHNASLAFSPTRHASAPKREGV